MTHYICTGNCHGIVSEPEYQNGKTACSTEGCPMKGQPFVECNCENPDVHKAEHHGEEGHHDHSE